MNFLTDSQFGQLGTGTNFSGNGVYQDLRITSGLHVIHPEWMSSVEISSYKPTSQHLSARSPSGLPPNRRRLGLTQIPACVRPMGTAERIQLEQPEMVGILGLQRAHQNIELR
jgi:hypothetical protein